MILIAQILPHPAYVKLDFGSTNSEYGLVISDTLVPLVGTRSSYRYWERRCSGELFVVSVEKKCVINNAPNLSF